MNKLIIFLFILALSGCANSKNSTENKQVSGEVKKEILSTWKGILPCADCTEIHYILTLLPSGKYDETYFYLGKSVEPLISSGTWSLSSDSMLNLKEKESKRFFYFDGNELIMRDTEGKKISSSFEKMVHLQRSVSEESTALWNKKMLEGINFTASGNEPFWSLDIKFDSSIHFKTMEGLEFVAPIEKGVKAADANVTRYRSVTANGEVIIQLFRQPCIDNMSGNNNTFKVDVQLKMKNENAYKKYEGCGRFIGDYRLNDIWALQRVGNKEVEPKEFQNGIPTLEFQLNEGKIYGFGGCNRFFGNIQLEDEKISFSKIGSTELACPDLKLETEFLSSFSDKTLSYKVRNIVFGRGGEYVGV